MGINPKSIINKFKLFNLDNETLWEYDITIQVPVGSIITEYLWSLELNQTNLICCNTAIHLMILELLYTSIPSRSPVHFYWYNTVSCHPSKVESRIKGVQCIILAVWSNSNQKSSVTRSKRPLSSTKSNVLGCAENYIKSDQFGLSDTDIFVFDCSNLKHKSRYILTIIISTPKHIKHKDTIFHIFLSPER